MKEMPLLGSHWRRRGSTYMGLHSHYYTHFFIDPVGGAILLLLMSTVRLGMLKLRVLQPEPFCPSVATIQGAAPPLLT
jgi:hypothetical protein